ncbi:apolipoprotein N-acyltransferase [Geodermatophilus sp. TF02-6]|uniref:apolipoprotein N-acyltransferase n=1 Tax=Geodermatophilus sp. TF02-6 TaxID=2250575 RepID=UPI000DE8DB45|nr:apolipoprotein N-acyltransferase [Geodermatophilus sp. TF02-6]RBY78740.1 apolipoprotein N-acyltransferase [Geodermatophilus sp. TF02-6]
MPPAAGSGTLDRPPAAAEAALPARRRRRGPWRTLLAAAGGLLLLFAFPAWSLWELAPLGPAALALAVHRQRARAGAWLGLVFGLCFFVPLLSWSGVFVGAFPWLALATSQAVFLAALGAATAAVGRLPGWPLWTAALWVAAEALRGRLPLGGFPWGRLGFSQTEGPFLALAAYGGVPLVGFAVALTGTLLAAAVLRLTRRGARRGPRVRGALACLAGAVAVPLLGGLAWLPLPGAALTAGGPTRTVAVVQGDVPQPGLEFNERRRAVLDNHVTRTLELADAVAAGEQPQPDLVVWPENSSDIDPYRNADAAAQISRAARAVGAPILVGAVVDGPGRFVSNTGIVWDPATGPGETYVKRHPVPLAEYVPARGFFRVFSDQVDLVRRDFTAGTEVGLLDVGGARVGDVICFEVVYDGLVRDVVRAGAGMVVVQTNNATFGYTDESAQQLAAGRVRAVEFGRTVAVASTSGISALIAPDGSLVARSGLYQPAVFVAEVAQRDSTTLAERLGAVPEWTLGALGAGALLAVAVPGTARRGTARRRRGR